MRAKGIIFSLGRMPLEQSKNKELKSIFKSICLNHTSLTARQGLPRLKDDKIRKLKSLFHYPILKYEAQQRSR